MYDCNTRVEQRTHTLSVPQTEWRDYPQVSVSQTFPVSHQRASVLAFLAAAFETQATPFQSCLPSPSHVA